MYEPADYQFLRVYKCINYVGQMLMLSVFHWGLTLPPNETLIEYVKSKNNYSNAAFRKRYNEDNKKKIEAYNVHNGKSFDVPILYCLIQDTSDNIGAANNNPLWQTPNTSQLEHLLYSMKSARNHISHSQISLDRAGAHQTIEKYRTLFINLLDAAGIRYGRDVAEEKKNLNKDIDEIINYPLIENEIQQLFREQTHERSKNKMVTEGVMEVKEKYKGQSDLNPLPLMDGTSFRLPVMKVYKNLEIRDCGRHSKNMLIDSNDIIRLDESCKTVADINDAVDLVIMEGPTGSGKTTITKKLIAEWSTNPDTSIKGLLDYNFLIYMECRNPNIESLNNLLHCMMPQTYHNLEGDPKKTLSACTVLIVMDSLDELNDKSEVLLKELLELLKMKNITGICTMRPTKTQEVLAILPSELKRVYLKSRGIPDDQRGPFVEMYHSEFRKQGKSDQNTQDLIQHLSKSSSRLQEHLRYPINLVHLVYLWSIDPQKVKFVKTATGLYSSIHEVGQLKLSERLMNNSLTKALTDEERKARTMKFMEALYIEAMLNLTRQNFCILPKDSETVLKKVCKENELPQSDMLSAFLVTKSLWTGINVETEYSISHTDMQEYLAACCIFKAVKDHNYRNKLETRIFNERQCGVFSMDSLKRSFRRSNSMNFVPSTLTKSPITEVLKLFFPNSEIPLKDYQNVLKHLSGLFVLHHESVSSNVAKDLIKLFKKSGTMQPEDWLDIYAETKSDKFLMKYLRKECGDMLSGDIVVKDSRLAAYAVLLAPKSSQAYNGDAASGDKINSLIINLKNPPSELPDLKVLMSHARNFTCNVELHIYHHWRKPKPGAINDILNETHRSCNLKVLRGSPSSSELGVQQSKLQRLYISICDDNHARNVLPMLSSRNLPKLRAIYVHLKYGDVVSGALSPLNFCNKPTIDLFLSDVNDSNVGWAAEVARALQLSNGLFHCLYLPNNQLTSSGFMNLVNSLHQSNVKILVRIGVTSDIKDEELDEALDAATKEARRKLQCDLLWYFSAERMEGW